MSVPALLTFGSLLRYLRKQAGMTQGDLAAALGYSTSLISSLETGDRLPDLEAVRTRFTAALGLQDDPQWALGLIEQAALARGTPMSVGPSALPLPHRPLAPGPDADTIRLPTLPTALIGRTNDINQLCNRLLGHAGRLLTLTGPPGVGKTTLSLAVAAQVQHHYADGVCFVPLAAVNDAAQMASGILSTIAPDDASSRPPQDRLLERLRRKNVLLILDNLEQIADAASLIATMLDQCPALTILATSRERLHLRAEQRFKVPPLDLASAIRLFVQRAQAVDNHFLLTRDNEATIAALCTRLDCLPLALELCAAQVEVFTPAQMLDHSYTHPLDLLVDGPHDLPPHQRTLRHTLQRSYDLLQIDEQALFRRLAVFAGGFDRAAAETMGDWPGPIADSDAPLLNLKSPISLLQSLIVKSLVRTETLANGEQRFSLLETIREFALEQLQQAGEDEAARQRHYAIYLQRFRSVDTHLRGPDAPTWFARLQPEHDNLRAAVQWTFDQARYVDTAWLLVATIWYCRLRGHWYEEFDWLQSLLPHRHRFEPRLRLAFLISLFSVASSSDDATMAYRYTDELEELRTLCPDKHLNAGAVHFVAVATSDFAQAKYLWQQALEMARTAVDSPKPSSEFGVCSDRLFIWSAVADNLALHLIEHGKFAEANTLIQESLHACQARGFRSGVASCLAQSGRLWLLQGDLARAYPLLCQAGISATEGIHPSVLAKVVPFLALAILYQNDAVEARRLLLESLEIWMSIRDKRYLSRICIYLAEVSLWENQIDEAEQWISLCVAYQVDSHRIGIALVNCFLIAARLAVVRRRFQLAAVLFGVADEMRFKTHCTLVAPVCAQVDAALAAVQSALDPVTFADAFAAGRRMTQAEAFALLSTVLPAEVRQDNLRQQAQSLNVA